MMAKGEQTAWTLTAWYLSRIKAIDRDGPKLRSVMELNPDAPAIAQALDEERKTRGPRGPLHGIPILLKDNIATADRTETTAGSLALVGHKPQRDSTVAANLRKAGAVLLGKANMTEWAKFRSRFQVSGWSSRGGQCDNPYESGRNPCGSSSGSAVATSANLCAAAIGTETWGSIICPSSTNGIVGLKPTVGLVSRAGVIPIAASFDTTGPMTRTVRDAALLLEAMQGVDARDDATTAAATHAQRKYAAALDSADLRGKRIGVARKLFGFHPRVDALIEDALQVLAKRGAVLIDPIDVTFPRPLFRQAIEVMLFEAKSGLNAYLADLAPGATRRTLADIIAFNEEHRDEVMLHFGQELLIKANKCGGLDDPKYQEALTAVRKAAREDGIDRVVKDHTLDALVAPSGSPAWMTDAVLGDHFIGGSASLAALAGYPHITVPAGRIAGLPVGMSLFGPAWSEPGLLALAHAFETATQHRQPPFRGESVPDDAFRYR